MKKRMWMFALILALLLGLCGCGGNQGSGSDGGENNDGNTQPNEAEIHAILQEKWLGTGTNTLEFTGKGTCIYNGEQLNYRLQKNASSDSITVHIGSNDWTMLKGIFSLEHLEGCKGAYQLTSGLMAGSTAFVQEKAVQVVELTMDNWSQYLEWRTVNEMQKDDFGDFQGYNVKYILQTKPTYRVVGGDSSATAEVAYKTAEIISKRKRSYIISEPEPGVYIHTMCFASNTAGKGNETATQKLRMAAVVAKPGEIGTIPGIGTYAAQMAYGWVGKDYCLAGGSAGYVHGCIETPEVTRIIGKLYLIPGSPTLVGTWKSLEGGTCEFASLGTGTVNGTACTWKYQADSDRYELGLAQPTSIRVDIESDLRFIEVNGTRYYAFSDYVTILQQRQQDAWDAMMQDFCYDGPLMLEDEPNFHEYGSATPRARFRDISVEQVPGQDGYRIYLNGYFAFNTSIGQSPADLTPLIYTTKFMYGENQVGEQSGTVSWEALNSLNLSGETRITGRFCIYDSTAADQAGVDVSSIYNMIFTFKLRETDRIPLFLVIGTPDVQ